MLRSLTCSRALSAGFFSAVILVGCGGSAPSSSPVPDVEQRGASAAKKPGSQEASRATASTGDPTRPGRPAPDTSYAVGKARVRPGDILPWHEPRIVTGAYAEPPAAPTKPPSPTWRLVRTIQVGVGYLSSAELSPDGSQVFVLSDDDGVLRRYDVTSGKELNHYQYPHFSQFDAASFALLPKFSNEPSGPPSQALYSSRDETGVLDLESGAFDPTSRFASEIRATGRPGLFALTSRSVEPQAGEMQLVWIPGPAGGDRSALLQFIERPDNWVLSKDGKLLTVLYYPSDSVEVLDLEARVVRLTVPTPKYARGLALSPDEKLLAVGGDELRLYDAVTGELLATDRSFTNNIHELRFTPDGQLLLASAYDGKARSFRIEGKKLGQKQLLAHSGTANVYALGLDHSGTRLVTSSGDKTIKIWQR